MGEEKMISLAEIRTGHASGNMSGMEYGPPPRRGRPVRVGDAFWLAVLGCSFLGACASGPEVAVINGKARFFPALNVSNCVSSLSTDPRIYIPPFACADAPALAWRRLYALLLEFDGIRIVERDDVYLHALVRDLDLEFALEPASGVIDVQFISRYDLRDRSRAFRNFLEYLRVRFGPR